MSMVMMRYVETLVKHEVLVNGERVGEVVLEPYRMDIVSINITKPICDEDVLAEVMRQLESLGYSIGGD